jgi:hypothetical protein
LLAISGRLEGRQRCKFVFGKLKYLIEANNAKDAPGSGRYVAKNQSVIAIRQKLSQTEQAGNARRCHYIHSGEIHVNVAIAAVTADFNERFQLTSHPRLSRQVDKNHVIRPVLKTHYPSPNT